MLILFHKQKGEEAHVKGELATVLKASRYNKFFSFSEGEKGPCKCSKLVSVTNGPLSDHKLKRDPKKQKGYVCNRTVYVCEHYPLYRLVV